MLFQKQPCHGGCAVEVVKVPPPVGRTQPSLGSRDTKTLVWQRAINLYCAWVSPWLFAVKTRDLMVMVG
jgi:hypothetical protein